MSPLITVPAMLVLAGLLMSFAWIGHLRYQESWSFGQALVVSWLIVLPEYLLNVYAARLGSSHYSGAQMSAMHLAAGVVFVTLISRYHLGETLTPAQLIGFGLMIVAILLIIGGR